MSDKDSATEATPAKEPATPATPAGAKPESPSDGAAARSSGTPSESVDEGARRRVPSRSVRVPADAVPRPQSPANPSAPQAASAVAIRRIQPVGPAAAASPAVDDGRPTLVNAPGAPAPTVPPEPDDLEIPADLLTDESPLKEMIGEYLTSLYGEDGALLPDVPVPATAPSPKAISADVDMDDPALYRPTPPPPAPGGSASGAAAVPVGPAAEADLDIDDGAIIRASMPAPLPPARPPAAGVPPRPSSPHAAMPPPKSVGPEFKPAPSVPPRPAVKPPYEEEADLETLELRESTAPPPPLSPPVSTPLAAKTPPARPPPASAAGPPRASPLAPSPRISPAPLGPLVARPGGSKRSLPPPLPPSLRPQGGEAAAAARQRKPQARPWWEELFGDDFLRTQPQLDRAEISRQVDFMEQSLGLAKSAMVLDLGCGTGRHAVEMAARGYQVVGVDLSLAMLSRAADEAQARDLRINFIHQDVREIAFEEAFDGVYCVGTSLGYFDDEKNIEVIQRVQRALKNKGLFLLEVANRDHVIRTQPNLIWFEGDGCVCMEETNVNYISSRLHVKRTMILDDGRQSEIEYSVRLYSLHELGWILHTNGFRVTEVSGHRQTPGAFFGPTSPWLVILAEKRAPGEEAAATPEGSSSG